MSQNLSFEDWQQVKLLASRLQAISNLIESVDESNLEITLNKEAQMMQEQLKVDFHETMKQLIDLIEKYD